MLDGAGDADGQVHLGGDGLAGAADLALHGEPTGIADGPRSRQLRAEDIGQLLDDGDVVGFLDAAADGDDDLGGGQVDGALRLAEQFQWINAAGGELRREFLDCCSAGFDMIGAIGAGLQRGEIGRVAGEADVHVEFALKELAHQDQFAILDAMRDHVTDGHAAERGGQLGQEIAHLVSVREDHDAGSGVFD